MMIFGALAIIMAGCTRFIDSSYEDASSVPEWVVDIDVPVPVELKVSSIPTRGAITSLEDMTGKTFRVFADNKNNEGVLDIAGMETLDNREAVFKKYSDGSYGFDFGKPVPCYPVVSEGDYSFYAYHFYGSSHGRVRYEDDNSAVYVRVVTATDEDVLWGVAQTDGAGFNAKYLRQGGLGPNLRFKHVTAGVSFKIKAHQTLPQLKVKAITYYNIPTKAELCIIDKRTGGENRQGSLLKDTYMYGNLVFTFDNPLELSDFYHELFIAPEDTDYFKCTLTLVGDNGEFETSRVVANPEQFLTGSLKNMGYVSGYKYNYDLFINSNYELELQKRISNE